MSDEPSDAQKLIAEVIGGHRYDISDVHVHRCVCGAVIGRDPDALDMHRAAEVDKALGGLKRKSRYRAAGAEGAHTPCWDSTREAAVEAMGWHPDDYDHIESQDRWVSGWTVTE